MGIFDALNGIGKKVMDVARRNQEEADKAYQNAQKMDYRELAYATDKGTFGERSGYTKAFKERIRDKSKNMSYNELLQAWESAAVPIEKQSYATLIKNEIKKESQYMTDREVANKFQSARTSIEKSCYAKILEKRGYLEKNSDGKYKKTSKRL